MLLPHWLKSAPPLGKSAEADRDKLAAFIDAGETILQALPSPAERSSLQSDVAASIHNASRSIRRRYMDLHADWLYRSLTEGMTRGKRLETLVSDASERIPGLVPTSQQLDEERAREQCNKDGREIDQAIFVHGILRSPACGLHLIQSMLRPTQRALNLQQTFQQAKQIDLGAVEIECRHDVAYLTIKNLHCLNAEDNCLVGALETAIDLVLLNDEIRVGVLRGAQMTHPRYAGRRVFSSGINLKELNAGKISFIEFLMCRELGLINKLMRGIVPNEQQDGLCTPDTCWQTKHKPWIAAVDSFAIGGGAQLLLAFDRVIAEADSYFSLPAAQEGIVPGFANLRLARSVGTRMSKQIILCDRKIHASEPEARWLFDEIVNPDEIDAAIERNALALSRPAVIANRHMLNVVGESLDDLRRYAAEFSLVQAERIYSADVLKTISKYKNIK